MHVKGVRKVARANPMARNQRRRVQEALFSPAQSTTPPEEEKAAERTETPKTDIRSTLMSLCIDQAVGECEDSDDKASLEEHIARQYGIEPNCTNVPRILYAILCEVVRGRV